MKMTVATALAATILFGGVSAAGASTVAFSDFGPGMTFDTNISDALDFGLDPGGISPGYAFTASKGGTLSAIYFAASYSEGPNVTVSLWTGSGFGTELGSWDLSLPTTASVTSVSLSGPAITLVAGQNYLFQILDSDGASSAAWYQNSIGASGSFYYGDLPFGAASLGAFEVDVAGAPEPAAWALTMMGFAGLGGALRARRRFAAA